MYELTKIQEENCMNVAKHYLEKGDKKLAQFWENASRGYRIKAEELKLSESDSFYEDYDPFSNTLEEVEYIEYVKYLYNIEETKLCQILKVIIYPTGIAEIYKGNKKKHIIKIKKQKLETFYNQLISFVRKIFGTTEIIDDCTGKLKIQFKDGNNLEYDREETCENVCLEMVLNEFFWDVGIL